MAFTLSSSTLVQDPCMKLKQDIKFLERQISENESIFNMVDNEELIEYSIYVDNALRAKHSYLMQRYKELLKK